MTEDNRKENTEEERDAYITTNQKHRLILFVERHYSTLFELSSISGGIIAGKLWKALTVQLNYLGPKKNESGWRRCFISYKATTRLKLQQIKAKRVPAEELNETDFRIMKMCRMETYGIDLNLMLSQDAANSYELVVPAASTNHSGLLTQEIENVQSDLQNILPSSTSNQQPVRAITSLKGIQTIQTTQEALESTSNDFFQPDFPENNDEQQQSEPQSEKQSNDSSQQGYEKGRQQDNFNSSRMYETCETWYKIVETIEHEDLCVTYVPGLWENDNTLYWPPWANVNRKDMSTPDNSWHRYQCRVLKECETHEEAKILEKRYSQHRDSNSFRQAEAQKRNKRDHPVNSIECESNNLIDVTHMLSKTSRKAEDANENKEIAFESLPKTQPSKIPKLITTNRKRHSGRITKYQKTGTANLKTKIDIKKVVPLLVKPSIPLQMKNPTKKTSQTETFGGKKKDNIGKTDNVGKRDSQNEIIPKTSKYHTNCTVTSKKKSGTANLKQFEFDFIPIRKTVPTKFIKSNPLRMKNKTNETSKTEECNGKTVDNVEKILSATSTGFDENRDYVGSFLKKYHTRYMTNEDNVKDSSEETMERENQNSSRKNQKPDEIYRSSDLADEGSLIRVGKRSTNEIDVNASGNNETESDSLPKQSKKSKNMKALSTHYRKPAKGCGGQWRVESVEMETMEIHTSPLENSERNECMRKNYKRKGTAKSTEKNDLLRGNDSIPKSIKTNHSRKYVAQPMIKPASTSTDADFQSKVLSAVNEIQNFCVKSEQKRIAFEAKIQSSFNTFTRETLSRFNSVRAPVHTQIRAPVHTQIRAPVHTQIRAPVHAPIRAPVHAPIRAPVHAPIRAPVHAPIRAPFRKPIRVLDRAPDRLAVRTSFREPIQFDEDEMEEFDQNFEIKSKDNLEELEWALRADLDVKHKLLYRFNEFGGEDEKAAIRLKMKYLVHDTVLDLYTWRGTPPRGPYPPLDAFKNLVNINNLIFRSVREQFPSYKRSDYNKYLVQWLKHSTTRQRTVTYTYPEHYQRRNEDHDDDDDEDDNYGGDQNDSDESIDNIIYDEDE